MDSREVEQGEAVRRRRECLSCTRRFTTVERVSQAVLWVLKRSGHREPFDRHKVIAGARAACKNRPVQPEQLEALAAAVEQTAWSLGPEVQSEQLGLAVLEALREARRRGGGPFCQRLQGLRAGRRLRPRARAFEQGDDATGR